MTTFLTARRGVPAWTGAALASLALAVAVTESRTVTLAVVVAVVVPVVAVVAWHEPRWAVLGLVFAVYADLPDAARTATGLPFTVRGGLLLVAALVLARKAAGLTIPSVPRRAAVLSAATLVVVVVSSLAAADRGVAWARLSTLAVACGVALLIAMFLREPPWVARAAWSVAAAGAMLATLSLLQQATGTYASTYAGLAKIKLDGSVARSGGPYEPNFFAQALVLSAALALYLALRARTRLERTAALALASLSVGGIAATASRGAAIAVLVVVVLVLALRRPSPKVMLAVGASCVAVAVFALPPSATERLSTVSELANVRESEFVDVSVRGRVAENLAAMHMFAERPFLGVGAGNFPVRYADYATFIGLDWRPMREPHNLYLETVAETGVVGGCVFLVFLLVTAGGAWQARSSGNRRQALLAEGIFVGMVGVLTTGIFLHGAYPHIAWTAFGLAWAVAAVASRRGDAQRVSYEAPT